MKTLKGVATGVLMFAAAAMGDTFPNTLWLGTGSGGPILNTTTNGFELRRIDSMQALGIAVDSNTLYVNETGSGVRTFNLDTLQFIRTFSLQAPAGDMTFSGGFLWTADFFNNAVAKVDPVTGMTLAGGFSVGFNPLGLTTDGAGGFWVSGLDSRGAQVLRHFGANGSPNGDIDPSDIVNGLGGLGFDPRDGTLYVGTLGRVYHFSTTGPSAGADLGFFDLADPGMFAEGLEFDPGPGTTPAVPEPTSLLLLGTVVLAMAGIQRRLQAHRQLNTGKSRASLLAQAPPKTLH